MMKKIIAGSTIYLLPMMAFAGGATDSFDLLGGTATSFGNLVTALVPIVFTLALLVFFWGLVKYIWGEADEKEKSRNIMIWGIVALFVMSSVWGIVNLLRGTFGVGDDTDITIPTAS